MKLRLISCALHFLYLFRLLMFHSEGENSVLMRFLRLCLDLAAGCGGSGPGPDDSCESEAEMGPHLARGRAGPGPGRGVLLRPASQPGHTHTVPQALRREYLQSTFYSIYSIYILQYH